MKHFRNKNTERQRLLHELEISTVPPAVENRLRQVYAELPGEVPQSYAGRACGKETADFVEVFPTEVRPMSRLLRGALGVCVAVAAAFIILLGMNASYPEFTESLPGLGGLFAKVNESWKNPMGSNLDTYDDLEQVSAVALSDVDSGYSMTVDEAFCDGQYVYFTLEIDCPEDAVNRVLIPGSYETDGTHSLSSVKAPVVTINGVPTGTVSGGSAGNGIVSDNGKLAMAYALDVPGKVENGEELKVTMQVDYLKIGEQKVDIREMKEVKVNFTAEFTVTANTAHNRIVVGEGQDNGVSILGVESTPGYIKIDLEAPVWGYEGEEDMLRSSVTKGIPNACYLYTEDGQELSRNSSFWKEDAVVAQGPDFALQPRGTMVKHTLGFDGAPAGCKKVILRILELDYGSAMRARPETWDAEYVHDLFAELTIDLETGEAVPSDTYKKEGMKKLDSEEYINTPHSPLFDGGYLLTDRHMGPDYAENDFEKMEGWYYGVNMYADVEVPDITVRFLLDGEEIDRISWHDPEECEQPYADTTPDCYEYWADNGSRFRMISDANVTEIFRAMGAQTVPKWQLEFILHRDEDWGEVFSAPARDYDIQIQVIDNRTGEVLMDNPDMFTIWMPESSGVREIPEDGLGAVSSQGEAPDEIGGVQEVAPDDLGAVSSKAAN